MDMKRTMVVGATPNPARYAFLALRKLLNYGHEVIAVGNKKGEVEGHKIHDYGTPFDDVHTITLYLNPGNQKSYYDYFLSLNPKRIIFNPGTENEELQKMAEERGIEVVEGCTLVMLGSGEF